MNLEGCFSNVDLEILITLPTIENIIIDGSADVSTTNTFQDLDNLNLEIDGSGEMDLDVNVINTTSININGSGKIILVGTTADSSIEINGSAQIRNRNFESQNCMINLDGSGNCEVLVVNTLNARINGSGSVCYIDSPVLTSQIDGSGSISECQ